MGNPELENSFVCDVCQKLYTSNNYASHITKVCGKKMTEEERKTIRNKGKKKLAKLSSYQVMSYSSLTSVFQTHTNWYPVVQKFAQFLGISINNVPDEINTETSVMNQNILPSNQFPSTSYSTPMMLELTPQVTKSVETVKFAALEDDDSSEDNDVNFEPKYNMTTTTSAPRVTRTTTGNIPTKKSLLPAFQSDEDDSRDDNDFEVEEDTESESDLDVSSASTWNFKKGVKKQLKELGMYNRIPDHDPIIVKFRRFMETDLSVTSANHINQTTARVQRFFYFIQGGIKSNPKVLRPRALLENSDKVTEWKRVYMQSTAGGTPILNAGKALELFVLFLMTEYARDSEFCKELEVFKNSVLMIWKKGSRKTISKDKNKSDFRIMIGEKQLPATEEVRAVLNCKKVYEKVDQILSKQMKKKRRVLHDEQHKDYVFVLRYLFGIICLKCCHRPGVCQNMTLQSFMNARKEQEKYVIPVLQHKTSEHPALVAMDEVDFNRMQMFYKNLRKQTPSDEDPSNSMFFIKYSDSRQYTNITKEIQDFATANGFDKCTPTNARKAAETDLVNSKTVTAEQQSLVSEYLNHDEGTAKKYYRADSYTNAVAAQRLIDGLGKTEVNTSNVHEDVDTPPSPKSTTSEASSTTVEWIEKCYACFPLSITGPVPKTKDVRKVVTGIPHEKLRCFLTRFRRDREKLHIEKWATENRRTYRNGLPSDEELDAIFKGKGWNLQYKAFLKSKFLPTTPRKAEKHVISNSTISNLCETQQWKRLCVFETKNRGRGVKASVNIPKGDIMCNYKSVIIQENAAEYLQQAENTSYMFCVKTPQGTIILDATEDDGSLGRLINHSNKHTNVRPESFYAQIDGDKTITILFRATRDIEAGEEILYDYSDWSSSKTKPDWYNICPCSKCM